MIFGICHVYLLIFGSPMSVPLLCVLTANQIFYISCNPSTLAKNLSQLKNEYEVERIIPYDMFTHTPHIETIVILSCKK